VIIIPPFLYKQNSKWHEMKSYQR